MNKFIVAVLIGSLSYEEVYAIKMGHGAQTHDHSLKVMGKQNKVKKNKAKNHGKRKRSKTQNKKKGKKAKNPMMEGKIVKVFKEDKNLQ